MAWRSCWLIIAFSLNGIAAVDWSVRLPSSPICAVIGSTVVIPCSYDFPQTQGEAAERYNVSSEMWCLESSRCITPRYVFHSDGILRDPAYSGRVHYLGTTGSKNCSLRISDVRPSDSGTYVFYIVTEHPTQKMPEQSGVQLLVAGSPQAVAASASPPSGVSEGGALRLACCSPAAGPQARFSWFESTSLSPSHSGQVWNISRVTSEHSGSFSCQVQDGEQVRESAALSLDVEYAPRNTLLSASEEHPATLTCSSDANPPVRTFSWYEGAACLPSADRSFHPARRSPAAAVGGAGGRSTAASISAVESGLHCCEARNKHGSQSYSLTLLSSRDTPSADSSGNKLMIVGVAIAALLALIAIVAILMARRKKSSRHQSYVLTEATATEP